MSYGSYDETKSICKGNLREWSRCQAEVVRLKRVLLETEQNTDEALRLAESAKDELATHHVTANQWKKRTTELEQENKRYKDMLDRHSNNVSPPKVYPFIHIT
jgi:predicted nuclease with TOPRIM domain